MISREGGTEGGYRLEMESEVKEQTMSIEAIGGATPAPAAAMPAMQVSQVEQSGSADLKPLANQQVKLEEKGEAARENTADQVSLQLTLPRQTVETIEKISNISELLNSTAKGLRQTDQKLQQVGEMVENLGKIIKNFPPFPPDSEDRRDMLMSYQSLRQEINRLTVPPPPAPIYEHVQMFWKELFNNNKVAGIETPELKPDANDIQLQQVKDQLTFTGAAVKRLREALGSSL